MADYDDHKGAFSSFFTHGHNISIFFGIENYFIWAIKMRFSLGGLQAIGLIKADLLRNTNGNFSAANVKLTG